MNGRERVLLRGLWPWRELRNWAEVEEARRLGELERAEDLALSGSELAALGDRAFGGGEGDLSVPIMPSMACGQHFDAWTQARRSSGRRPEGSRNCPPPA